MLGDLRRALRSLLRQPRFTLVALPALALGVAVNATVFSIVDAVLVRPLPYREPGRLVHVWDRVSRLGLDGGNVSPANFVDYQQLSQSFERLEAYTEILANVASDDGRPERVSGLMVTPPFFDALGVQPTIGRGFRREDVSPREGVEARPVLLSHGFWQRRFGSDPATVGKLITLDGAQAEVVGVLPPGFLIPGRRFDIFGPLGFTQDQLVSGRGSRWLTVVGRLRPGVTIKQAQAEMDIVADRLAREHPDVNQGRGVTVSSLRQDALGRFRPALMLLQAAVGLVLLIAAANVAHLQLARSLSRRAELAIHAALGATRRALVRQVLAESLLLALMGAALGLLVARLWAGGVMALSPPDIPRIQTAGLDGRVIAFTFLVAGGVGLLFGLPLALHASKPDLHSTLKEGGRGSVRTAGHRPQALLVVVEVALSLVLLACAGLLVESFMRLQRVDPGFAKGEAVAMDISLGPRDAGGRARFFEELIERIEAQPGVRSAGVTKDLPLSGEGSRRSFVVLDADPSGPPTAFDAECRRVSAHYFDAMGIVIRKGRGFDGTDMTSGSGVVIVNSAFVQRFLPGQDPVGRRLLIRDGPPRERRVIGVVADVKHFGLDAAAVPEMYVPHTDRPWPNMTLVVRVDRGDPKWVVTNVRRELAALDKGLPMANVRTIGDYVAASTAPLRFSMRLVAAFAALALLLAALGVYGVTSYVSSQRTHEVAIRMALGAERRDIVRLILGDGLRSVMVGLMIGLAGALVAGRLMRGILFDVGAADPLVLGGVVVLLAVVALLACYLPARRSSRLDPAACTRL